MTRKEVNIVLRSALYKYAFDPKNPTGAGLPASVTAPKPLAPMTPSLLSAGPHGGMGGGAPQTGLPPAAPKLTGLASASIGAAPQQSTPSFRAQPNNSSLLGLNSGGPVPTPPPTGGGPTMSLAGTAAPGAPQTLVTGGSAPLLPQTSAAPTDAAPAPATQPMPQTGTMSLNADGSVNTSKVQPGSVSAQNPAMTLSGGSSSISAPPAKPSAPAMMDIKAQDEFASSLKNLPPEQAKAKAQEGVQAHFQALPPAEQKGVSDLSAGKADTPEAKNFEAKVEGPVKEQFVKDEYGKQVANNPNVSPQQAGGIMNGIMESWNNMPTEMKWMMGIGLGGGLLGVLGSMFGGGGGMGMLGLLGLGAAGLAGAAGGMFGQGAQDMMGGMVGQLGQATGMIPKDMDLSALKGTDAVQRATQQSSGGGILGGLKAWWDPKGEAAKVKGQLGQADQLNRLMMVPEGMRAGLLKQISPNSSPAEVQQILANAKQMHGAMNDPKHQLAQNMQKGREFSADPEKYIRNTWVGGAVGSSLTDPDQRGWAADAAAYSNPITGTATGLYDMGRNAYEGDWWGVGRGALNTASSFIPGGSLLKGLGRAAIQTGTHMMKPASDRGYELANAWAKEADEKAVKEWLSKYRARGQKGRWVNTQRSAKMEKRVTANNN